ncbi:hypothetical protein C0991_001692 [Blastosporella zonata]|nr:hypothetical protein C0991_001692 [Blastosporella zonata]
MIHHFVLLPNPWFGADEPPSENNVPYNTIPVVRRLLGSPVRLFSTYHMALGSRGTAVWIDSHTDFGGGDGARGQRLAGSCASELLDADDDELYDDLNEMASSMDASVFGYSENDEWTRVAVDEEEGRIAIGYLDGTILLNEYA